VKIDGAWGGRGCVFPGLVTSVKLAIASGRKRPCLVTYGTILMVEPGGFGRAQWGHGPWGDPWFPIEGAGWGLLLWSGDTWGSVQEAD
jgi:hypothetical protein